MKNLLNFKASYKLSGARLSLAPLLILFYLLPVQLLSQQSFSYFNKRIDFNNNYDDSRSILASDSSYLIASITEDSIYNYYIHIVLSKLNSKGEKILYKGYGFDGADLFFGNPGSMVKVGSQYYTSGTKRFYTSDWVHDEGILICYDSIFDTLWTKRYGEKNSPYDTAFMLYQLKRHQNGSFIFTGLRYQNGNVNHASRIWLLKTDSLGNKLWERFYGEGAEHFQGHSVVQTSDGGYVIGGGKFKIGWSGTLDPLIIRTDSLGNEEWRINPGNPNVDDNKVMVALAQDGNIIAGTNYGTEQHVDNRDAVVKIMKITPEGTVLWDNNYLEPKWDNFLLNTTILDNGNIITNGSYTSYYQGEEYPSSTSWILCVDSLGNQLWYKEYALLTGHNSNNNLYDVRETPDGGLIGCGLAYPVVPDTGTADIWLMKMDSTGCLYAGCDTTVVIDETAIHYGDFTLYPNPVIGEFTIDIDKPFFRTCRIVFYNLYGVKMGTINIPKGKRIMQVDASGWQPGLYVAIVSQQGKIVKKKKFVVK